MLETNDIDIKVYPPEVTLDEEKGIRVVQGVPTEVDKQGFWNPPGTEMIVIPNVPHIFNVNGLTVRDKNHPTGEELTDVNVLMAHGVRSDNRWKFPGGADVIETVDAYNRFAVTNGSKPIEFLVVCNRQEPHPLGIRIGDFDARQNIAYAVGEDVHLAMGGRSKVETGKTVMEVSVDKTFFGLDQLIKHKRIQSRI